MPHPIATPEQHEHELQALELIRHPTVVLSGRDLVLEDDRRFTITVDRAPAAGRPNHVQSAQGC